MSRSPLQALTVLLGVPEDTPVILQRLDELDWGRTLVFTGTAGTQGFQLRYDDCRELRWRVYAHETGGATAVVSFAPGRDQQRSPAQWLTGHFGLSLFYGSVKVTFGD
ncbi:MAG: hypothetical protein ABI835_10655 [Chloroflexota bacterium]